MAKPSAYLTKLQVQKAIEQDIAVNQMKRFTLQQCLDIALITLGREFGFGEARAGKFSTAYMKIWDEYIDEALAEAKDDTSIAYIRGKIDRELKIICGKYFQPWDERYNF